MKKYWKELFIFVLALMAFIPFMSAKADGGSRIQVVHTNGGGVFTISGGSYDGSESYSSSKSDFFDLDISITLTATANDGYSFAGWFTTSEEETDEPGVMEWVIGNALSSMETYTFTVTEPYYNIMPVFEKSLSCSGEIGHNNIWATTGGKVSVLYDAIDLDGTHYGIGEVVDYCVGDSITINAQADDGYMFVGWYGSNVAQGPNYYNRERWVSDEETYTYQPGVTTMDDSEETINYLTAVFKPIVKYGNFIPTSTEFEEVPADTDLANYVESKKITFDETWDEEWLELYGEFDGVYRYPKTVPTVTFSFDMEGENEVQKIYDIEYVEVIVVKKLI